jgi:predicted RNase H-like HicB family nuclease
MTTEPRYHINVLWYPVDNCRIADVPDLRPCSAHGDTPVRAVANLRDAIAGW